MQELLKDFNERKQEIQDYYKFLKQIDSKTYSLVNKRTKINNYFEDKIVKILKANFFLLLYNLIESTVDKSIDYILVQICQQNIKYEHIIEELQMQWAKVHTKKDLQSKDSATIERKLNGIINKSITDYVKFEGDYKPKVRDNIDADELRKIAADFGLNFSLAPSLKGGIKLNTIKLKRNDLAHGKVSFSECGRDYSTTDLNEYKKDTFAILEKFIKTVDKYLQKQIYKNT